VNRAEQQEPGSDARHGRARRWLFAAGCMALALIGGALSNWLLSPGEFRGRNTQLVVLWGEIGTTDFFGCRQSPARQGWFLVLGRGQDEASLQVSQPDLTERRNGLY